MWKKHVNTFYQAMVTHCTQYCTKKEGFVCKKVCHNTTTTDIVLCVTHILVVIWRLQEQCWKETEAVALLALQ